MSGLCQPGALPRDSRSHFAGKVRHSESACPPEAPRGVHKLGRVGEKARFAEGPCLCTPRAPSAVPTACVRVRLLADPAHLALARASRAGASAEAAGRRRIVRGASHAARTRRVLRERSFASRARVVFRNSIGTSDSPDLQRDRINEPYARADTDPRGPRNTMKAQRSPRMRVVLPAKGDTPRRQPFWSPPADSVAPGGTPRERRGEHVGSLPSPARFRMRRPAGWRRCAVHWRPAAGSRAS